MDSVGLLCAKDEHSTPDQACLRRYGGALDGVRFKHVSFDTAALEPCCRVGPLSEFEGSCVPPAELWYFRLRRRQEVLASAARVKVVPWVRTSTFPGTWRDE